MAGRVSGNVLFSRLKLSDGLLNLVEPIATDGKLQAQHEDSPDVT